MSAPTGNTTPKPGDVSDVADSAVMLELSTMTMDEQDAYLMQKQKEEALTPADVVRIQSALWRKRLMDGREGMKGSTVSPVMQNKFNTAVSTGGN